ncbi:glycoside hydrolase family 32 protein [Paenibacillus nasutitermitis]|uniref:beta-fructofuranosidase n=1 Tax=Paenibacillus nasutitermitis TaxID=1652958 RepID=A0A916ZBQ2_9BACL|nr:glycoside hydrolase family 32 protein [Paenibacillus nasutitermitis]GGD86795.1 glycosyl hydrolase family 32 [Paenibacillus nasutitermitis]
MDLYRPIYHFMPERNWMNDPNGPLFYKGDYHLFYQHNPYSDQWDTMHWGHARSRDLIHWEHLPVALAPSNDRGEHHCFSGCAVIGDDGLPVIFYTSIGIGERNAATGAEQWMAVSHDDMLTWEKPAANPVMTADIHGGMVVTEWRDPYVWKENGVWLMVVGGSHEGRGCALLYRSDNLRDWTFLHILHEGAEQIWECPNFFPLGDKHVLIYSPNGPVQYSIGSFNEDMTFTPEQSGIIDFSGWEGYYAPNGLLDDKGRRVLWGWLPEASRGEFKGAAGWSGAQSLPRILSLDGEGGLRMEPAPELAVLRGTPVSLRDLRLSGPDWDTGVRGRAFEIAAEFELLSGPIGISVLRSPDGQEETVFSIDPVDGVFTISRTRSSLSSEPHKTDVTGRIDLEGSSRVSLRLFVDHSVVEVFVNGRQCITARVYPVLESSEGVYIGVPRGAEALIHSMDIWPMRPIGQQTER